MRKPATLFALLLLPLAGLAQEDLVAAALKPVADAALKGDLKPTVEIMYEPIIKDAGGKEELLKIVADAKTMMDEQKIKMVRFDLVRPFQFVQGKERKYVLVPTRVDMRTPEGLIRAQGFQFGIEVTPGAWQFIDGARITPELLQRYFPDFPPNEKLPERKQEVVRK